MLSVFLMARIGLGKRSSSVKQVMPLKAGRARSGADPRCVRLLRTTRAEHYPWNSFRSGDEE